MRGKKTDIETKAINEIKPNPSNPRIIKDDKFHKLVESVKSFPEMLEIRPIVVNKDMIILWGNMRYKACKEAGLKEIPVIVADNLTEEQEREFLIKDNVSGGEWDWDILANEWGKEELEEWWLDVQFETVEPEVEEDDFEVDEGIKTDIVLWDLFEIWPHRILCGDSTNIDDVNKLMNGEKADMVFTDPPYNTGMTWESQWGDTLWKWDWKKKPKDWARLSHMFDDSYTDEEWEQFMSDFCSMYFMQMKDDTVCYMCLDWRRNYELIPHIKKHFHLSNTIVWDKMVHWLWSDYKYTYELINVCKKWKPELNTHQWEDREYSDVLHIQRKMWKDEDHATKKPIEIVERAIRHASKKGDIVLDLFWWSGSTMVACHQLNRKCYMSELDPKYVQTIINRMIKLAPTLEIKRNWVSYKIIDNTIN